MPKKASVYARIDADTKRDAENILDTLGISVSTVISMLYKQIIYQGGIPFEIKLPEGDDARSEDGGGEE